MVSLIVSSRRYDDHQRKLSRAKTDLGSRQYGSGLRESSSIHKHTWYFGSEEEEYAILILYDDPSPKEEFAQNLEVGTWFEQIDCPTCALRGTVVGTFHLGTFTTNAFAKHTGRSELSQSGSCKSGRSAMLRSILRLEKGGTTYSTLVIWYRQRNTEF